MKNSYTIRPAANGYTVEPALPRFDSGKIVSYEDVFVFETLANLLAFLANEYEPENSK